MEETEAVATFLAGGDSCATASRSISVMLGRATSRRLMRAPSSSRERGMKKKRRRERQRERERRGKERRMVFNSRWVATVATLSADECQYVACNPEWLSSEQGWTSSAGFPSTTSAASPSASSPSSASPSPSPLPTAASMPTTAPPPPPLPPPKTTTPLATTPIPTEIGPLVLLYK